MVMMALLLTGVVLRGYATTRGRAAAAQSGERTTVHDTYATAVQNSSFLLTISRICGTFSHSKLNVFTII